jgi:hypothetical protein
MYYANIVGDVPEYETDENGNIRYIDIDGTLVPVPTGNYTLGYKEPMEIDSRLPMSGGDSQDKAYGISTSDYDATIRYIKGTADVKEGALLWYESEIVYKEDGSIEPTSADYKVVKRTVSPNYIRCVLKALTK